jgi:hypothetical protein
MGSVDSRLIRVVAGGLGAFAAIGTASSVFADDQAPVWHGFFTTGVMFTDSPLTYDSGLDRRADVLRLSRVGLNIEKRLDPRWEFAAQLIADSEQINPDWAFVSWFPVKGLTLRAGKQKVPMWLMSDHIDVGHTYPWVQPPSEVYELNPMKSANGVGGTYTVTVGGIDISADIVGAPYAVEHIVSELTDGTSSKYDLRLRDLRVANLTVGNDHYQVRVAYAAARVGLFTDAYTVKTLHASFGTVGLKVDTHGFLLLSEYAFNGGHYDDDEVSSADATYAAAVAQAQQTGSAADMQAAQQAGIEDQVMHSSIVGSRAWYGTVGYQMQYVLPFVSYASLRSPKDSIVNGSQDSATAGLKYDASLMTDVKIQAQHVWPRNSTRGMYDGDPNDSSRTSFPQLNVYSAAVDVAF